MSEVKSKKFELEAELVELSRARYRSLDRDQAVRLALPLCARALRARRVGLWRFTEDKTGLIADSIYSHATGGWSAGEAVTPADHPRLWAVLRLARPRRDLGGRTAPAQSTAEVGEADPGVLDGLRSTAAAPIAPMHGDGLASGVLWCEPGEGRDRWTEHELIFVEWAAQLLWEMLASADKAAAEREAWRRRAEQLTALLAAIDVAFDGVPVPGEHHPTIHKAEASNWPTASIYDPSRDHRGRWQDLPLQHLRECPWALACLDAEGLHYYLPAIMTAEVRWHLASPDGGASEEHPGLLAERLRFMLTPDREDDLRDLRRAGLRLLSGPQRAVVGDYLRLTALGLTSDERTRRAWDRVAQHDRTAGPGSWFDAWWPDRPRPPADEVLRQLEAAFAEAAAPEDDAPARWQELAPARVTTVRLTACDAVAFRYYLPACMSSVLLNLSDAGGALDRVAGEALDRIESALRPDHRPEERQLQAARWALLDRPQRQAIAAFLQRCSRVSDVRTAWTRAAAVDDAGWLAVGGGPLDGAETK